MIETKTAPYSYPNSFTHVLKFNSRIDEPAYYSEFCDVLLSASETDRVEIYFNSGGGRGDSMTELLNIMDQCKAPIHGFLVGGASSSASYLFLHCDVCYVGKHVEMLCHQVSYGTGGSHHEIRDYVNHIERLESRLVKETYKYFLTDEEIDLLMNGKQIWLDEFEIAERLDKRAKAYEKEAQQAEQEFEELFDDCDPPDWVYSKLSKGQLIQFAKGESIITDWDDDTKKFTFMSLEEYENSLTAEQE